ncbi:TIGR03943 family putative permease subunit [Actinocorallia sp. A-T 12471]|uniref:TIGR03943 family putative permease subunit n=1 Tax=Actinocorallia sp. A-T 12471 TaxID=3089813 RepID=UPI0029CEA164|nr:TIGR03943 family protein [Actinocorallia sp. A-T 12471]MDX6744102.1 TIGR03943 family protein [Actinocorallia sp. A-T 12471]
MTRAAQNLLMVLVGATVLWITLVSGEVLNYVKPVLRYPLVAAALVLVALGIAGMRRDWRPADDDHDHHDGHGHDGHGHGHGGPKVAWLLVLPVVAVFAMAPPELGVFTAERTDQRIQAKPAPVADGYALPPGADPLPMSIAEFMGRSYEAQIGGQATLTDRRVRLTGFATTGEDGRWLLNRLQLNCCAADAITLRLTVFGAPKPPKGQWVEVVGVWRPAGTPDGNGVYELQAESVEKTAKPANPYA